MWNIWPEKIHKIDILVFQKGTLRLSYWTIFSVTFYKFHKKMPELKCELDMEKKFRGGIFQKVWKDAQ